jgi:hypothetical protein
MDETLGSLTVKHQVFSSKIDIINLSFNLDHLAFTFVDVIDVPKFNKVPVYIALC